MLASLRHFVTDLQAVSEPRNIDFEYEVVLVASIDAQSDGDDIISLDENGDASKATDQEQAVDVAGLSDHTNFDLQPCCHKNVACTSERASRFRPVTLVYEPNFNNATSSPRPVQSVPRHRHQPTRFHATTSRTVENLYQDSRSQSHARNRTIALNTKYFGFRAVKRGQLNVPHLHSDIDWYTRPVAVFALPADCTIVVMDRKLLYEEAQQWPKPLRRHRREADRYCGDRNSAVNVKKQSKTKQLDNLMDEARDLMNEWSLWDRNRERRKQFWGEYEAPYGEQYGHRYDILADDSGSFAYDEKMARYRETGEWMLRLGEEDCVCCESSYVGLCTWCQENAPEQVTRWKNWIKACVDGG